MGNIGVITEATTLLIITQANSGLKKITYAQLCKYKYIHVEITSLSIVKSCVTVHHFCGWQMFCLMHLPPSQMSVGQMPRQ